MSQLTLLTFQILFLLSILGFTATGAYYYYRSKKAPQLNPASKDYLMQSKVVDNYILLSNRNTNIGIIISVIFMALSIAVNIYK